MVEAPLKVANGATTGSPGKNCTSVVRLAVMDVNDALDAAVTQA